MEDRGKNVGLNTPPSSTLRVLVVDDSPFVLKVLRSVFESFEGVQVVAEATTGIQAERLVEELKPDVVTMDILMPMMSGMEAVSRITQRSRTPIIVLADVHGDPEGLMMEALARGAVDLFPKPQAGFDERSARRLVQLLRSVARTRLRPAEATTAEVTEATSAVPSAVPSPLASTPAPARQPSALGPQRAVAAPPLAPTSPVSPALSALPSLRRPVSCLGIVASTGGPRVLRAILEQIPASAPFCIVVVQHTVAGFAGRLASWLDAACSLPVTLATHGQIVNAGEVAIAPDDVHMELRAGSRVHLQSGPMINGHRPSGDALLQSIASSFGSAGAGLVLSGMGNDGADGLAALESAGGLALIEDPRTAVIPGMPEAAMKSTRNPVVAPAPALGAALSSSCAPKREERDASREPAQQPRRFSRWLGR